MWISCIENDEYITLVNIVIFVNNIFFGNLIYKFPYQKKQVRIYNNNVLYLIGVVYSRGTGVKISSYPQFEATPR